ncbi:MAG: lactate racemase domain-containing protein, partial [Alphaproteobacteria bacterium]|nr:lactate racemase domain-containing protein [Alphaproteobacteria bacterium]
MRIDLAFGKNGLELTLPDAWPVTVIAKPAMPVLADPAAAMARALAAPVGCPPLAEIARDRASACIVICDITRPVPNGVILPVLVRALLDAGLAAGAITVLVATGLHRPNQG